MKLKKTLFIVTTMILCSGCSSKDAFNKWGYNWLQGDDFCTNDKECAYKRLYLNDYTPHKKISYEEYKDSL